MEVEVGWKLVVEVEAVYGTGLTATGWMKAGLTVGWLLEVVVVVEVVEAGRVVVVGAVGWATVAVVEVVEVVG